MDISEGQIKSIVLQRMDRCRTCHRVYDSADVNIISRGAEMWMMLVECRDCHGRNFVAAIMNEADPAIAELAFERMTREWEPESTSPSPSMRPAAPLVSAGDVVDMHQFLASFDGDFARFFRRGAEPGA